MARNRGTLHVAAPAPHGDSPDVLWQSSGMPSRTFVIFHADDLGLSRGFNQGILRAASTGVLTSTCVRVNGAAYREALEEIRPAIPHVAIGLHLNLVEGHTRRPALKTSLLCDADGRFRVGFGDLLRNRRNPKFLAEIEAEYRDQIEIALHDGLDRIDHLNSHQHSHGVPEIFEIACKLAAEYGIPFVRLPRERFYLAAPVLPDLRPWLLANLAKFAILNRFARRNARTAAACGVRTNGRFVGILYTGHMRLQTVLSGVQAAAKQGGIIEVLFHPAAILGARNEAFLDPLVRDYVINPDRTVELATLTSPELVAAFRAGDYRITNYRAIADGSAESFATQAIDRTAAAHKLRAEQAAAAPPPLKTFFVLDETAFYHPKFFRRLICECGDITPCGVAIVVLPKGGKLQSYLLSRWRDLGLRDLAWLAFKRLRLSALGALPTAVRGRFDGSVRSVARRYGIPFQVISKINTPAFLEQLRALAPDVLVSSNSLIFGDELLRIPKLACINRHSALLPSNGGILPAFRAVQHGDPYFGASVHLMTSGIDEGEVLSRKWFPIFPGDTLDRLYRVSYVLSYEAAAEALKQLRTRVMPPPLDSEGVQRSYFSFPTDEDWREFRARGGSFI
jgi:predicted glycoside hydrolase/deacetylase ChbG (UPF0249 family)/folate-dependent phosphoribosylglycinamide formyltransferase PurN